MANIRQQIVSVKKAAERLKCTRQNVMYLLAKGHLTGWQVNPKCWVVDVASIEKREQEREGGTP
jgi:hypothetical protein